MAGQVITLIGMSGSGKSHLAKRLAAECGLNVIDCDELIENRLRSQHITLNQQGISGVAEWLGLPFTEQFELRQQQYLNCEKAVMKEILVNFSLGRYNNDDILIDSTGSLIYTGDEICQELCKISTVVYLRIDQKAHRQMLEHYLENPKPVIWGNIFSKQHNESNQQALERCYPELLRSRAFIYEKYAKHTISIDLNQRDQLTLDKFWEAVSKENSKENEIL